MSCVPTNELLGNSDDVGALCIVAEIQAMQRKCE